jgi:hypothetical protein
MVGSGPTMTLSAVYSDVVRPYPQPLVFSSKALIRMRPEIQTQLDNAKQSIGLLRRHL